MIEIVLVILLGIISSYTDIRYHKIKNLHILLALVIGMGLHTFSSGFWSNFGIALVVSFVLYYFGTWAAGDGKLFIAYASLMPLMSYAVLDVFSSLALLVNIFIVSLVGVCVLQIEQVYVRRKELLGMLAHKELFQELGWTFLGFLCLAWAVRYFISGNLVVTMLVAYVVYYLLFAKVSSIKIRAAIFGLCFIAGMLLGRIELSTSYFVTLLSFTLPFALARKSFDIVFTNLVSREIQPYQLKKGMVVISCPLAAEDGGVAVGKVVTDADSKRIVQLLRGHERLEIKETIPLAPFMFLAVIITLLIQTDVISFVMQRIL